LRNEKTAPEANRQNFMLRPTPTSLETPLRGEEDIAQHRRLYCGHYSNCLNLSVREGWSGFSCMHCPLRDHAIERPGSEGFAHQRRPGSGNGND
jgi:hypothetical protein